ncbi:MAG TPA: oxidase [Hyphomonas sp.]|nr:oxidase [Hyphomonas sp.]MAN91673.1 oxidase [Hyphomonadaceae bacterium]HBL93742.1 oxidase [Hyphomonas sp.]HCJ18838.1 oxidase [Hyphomonas sp.]|tara:strand:- start:97804 stop:99291 length:1488 start_codon:yes stop_codon:yes gene_type:complete
MGGLSLTLGACGQAGSALSQHQSERKLLKIPQLLSGKKNGAYTEYNLKIQNGTSTFFEGRPTSTIGVNQAYLGPTLKMDVGSTVRINVNNTLQEDTTLHWHGFHVPAKYDGTPHQTIKPGGTWTAQFEVRQKPSLFWYHSHAHKQAGPQVYRGLAGPIIVKDPNRTEPALPDTYGVDDLPLIVQDRLFGNNGELVYARSMHDIMMGMQGDTLLVNGGIDPVFECKTELLRLRLLNGSNSRIYDFQFADRQSFLTTGSDGGHLESALEMSKLRLSPGERAEILVDMRHGEPKQMIATPTSDGMGMMDDAMMDRGMMGGRWWREDNNRDGGRSAFNVLHIVPNANLDPSPSVPTAFMKHAVVDPAIAVKTRQFVLQMGMGMRAGNGFTINGRSMDMGRIDERVKLNTTEIWEIENASWMPHPFHIHDVQFRILDRNGRPPAQHETGLKDTVLLSPRERVRLLLSFRDYSDPDTPYMYHCHILEHEDAGMMGQFVVES